MFRKEKSSEESNFWISYADLMAGLLFVFILLIGAIVSKSIILKSDLHDKEDRLSNISQSLKSKENTLEELSDTLAKSKALVSEKDHYLSDNEKLLAEKEKLLMLKNTRIEEDKVQLSENEKLIQLKDERIAKDQVTLAENERVFTLKLSEIKKLNKMLLAANAAQSQLSDKIIIVQNMLDENKDILKKNQDDLAKNTKSLKDYEGKVVILSNELSDSKETVKIKDEKLLTLLNAMDEKKTKYDSLVANLQSQKAKIKSLTGIKLKVVAALKEALGENIDIDKKSGSLRLASNILFGSGQSTLKPEAKVALKRAFEEYIGTLITNPKIKPHLDKIIIEGHTDSVGSYIYNLNLSQKRALAVMEYLLTLKFTQKHNIRPLMTASGRAYLDAVMVEGVEDKNASRRIEIKFRLKNEDAMHEIEKVLDAK
jgi:chemotaxis protein MotB